MRIWGLTSMPSARVSDDTSKGIVTGREVQLHANVRAILPFIILVVSIFTMGNAHALDKSEQIKIFEQRIRSILEKNVLPIIDNL
jgi:hypothetical protein